MLYYFDFFGHFTADIPFMIVEELDIDSIIIKHTSGNLHFLPYS